MNIRTDITDEVPADDAAKGEVSKSMNMISVRFHAQEIANRMTAAYYVEAYNPDSVSYHIGLAERDLHQLAKYMGFRVEKIEEPAVEVTEAA